MSEKNDLVEMSKEELMNRVTTARKIYKEQKQAIADRDQVITEKDAEIAKLNERLDFANTIYNDMCAIVSKVDAKRKERNGK